MIDLVKMKDEEFRGTRTAYSSNAIFIAILSNSSDVYDHEAVGSIIFPQGFSCIEPPGPSFGFGVIELSEGEDNGKIDIVALRSREDDDGNPVEAEALRESLDEYFDAYFVVSNKNGCIRQVDFDEFYALFLSAQGCDTIQFCEFEPDEDEDEDDD